MSCQTNEMLSRYKEVENEVKNFCVRRKRMHTLNFVILLFRRWVLRRYGVVRTFAKSSQPLKTGICNDINFPVFKRL